jgi:hypothetical protein
MSTITNRGPAQLRNLFVLGICVCEFFDIDLCDAFIFQSLEAGNKTRMRFICQMPVRRCLSR